MLRLHDADRAGFDEQNRDRFPVWDELLDHCRVVLDKIRTGNQQNDSNGFLT